MAVAEKAKRLKAEGRDIISFSIGVPNFLPGDHVYAAARDALAKDSGQYGSNRGPTRCWTPSSQHIEAIGLTGYTRANVSTGIGAKHVIYNLAEALLDEGDTIAFPVAVLDHLHRHRRHRQRQGGALLPCPASQDYKLTPAQLDEALATHKPKVFLFNNPSNPTGMVYTPRRDRRAGRRAGEVSGHLDHHRRHLQPDAVRRAGVRNFVQVRPELRDRVIFIDSLSKTYGMPGWRVGFMAGPEGRSPRR
jgi:aspartate aminotransferase